MVQNESEAKVSVKRDKRKQDEETGRDEYRDEVAIIEAEYESVREAVIENERAEREEGDGTK